MTDACRLLRHRRSRVFFSGKKKAGLLVIIAYVFKTRKDLALSTLKKYARMSDVSVMNSTYDDYSQRLMPAVPYPIAPGIQTIIDHLAKSRAEAKGLNPNDFIDPSILKEIDDSGFVKKLYGK